MKKRFFFGSLFAAMLFTGCSSDDPGVGPNGGNSTGEPQFITVNLVTTGESGTRAEGDEDDPESDKIYEESYEEGLEEENTVTKARFYFFDENGNGANVKNDNGTYVNYLDWIPVSTDEPDMPNVEKILSATLILQTPDGDEMPKTMVVIVNPYKDLPTTINGTPVSLADLKKHVQNYAKDYATAGNFVMSNSTYASGGAEMMEVSVEGKIKPERAEALKDPVEVYVERTVAKVRLYLGSKLKVGKTLNDEVILYDPSKDDKEEKFGDKKIYVKFLGWNVTAAADASRLIKKINPNTNEWADNLLGDFGLWNWAAYFRSFWAVNVNSTDNGKTLVYQYGPFRESEKEDADNTFVAQLKKFDGKDNNYVYLNENASDNKETGTGATTPSQVIIAAQLVDESGNALEFAEYGSERYTLDGIKELFANNCGLYKKETKDGEVTYTKIDPSELQIKTSTTLGEKGDGERYKVYVQLTADAEEETWCSSNAENAQELKTEEANDMLKYLGSVKVWTEGYTYYYFNIEHGTTTVDGKKTPNYGVVRNHIYDATVTSLVGLGTPVYDPDEIIYPEKPEPGTDTYLAARIHILSWRVVNNSAKLEW